MADNEFALLKERFEFLTERESADHLAVNCPADKWIELATALRDDFAYDMVVDVTAIDWDAESPRFTGIYHFLSTTKHVYLRVAVNCEDDINPVLPSIAPLYASADWHERETYDLMGIRYEGHPELKRILMWDDYPYHPLRKDFPLAGIEVPFPAEDVAEQAKAKVLPAPMMGGPFVSSADGPMSQTEPAGKDQSWTEKDENRD
ncbi:NADH-quinone oxidoreductase subunit C [Coraliomargarita akajimensis]|uniref:NADH-quinone oxidoreductase subunit C n=1 Tax=Coraliomargarita akajimensis (strain DSM 45221 / IAM 15411 / JCM 23193 / KCTC 12865 / 04OKA010-24) TaxID=583355 RepID=D5EP75_CORAD|nr:NADH-quinone oxidoreductase subunit C [Coraliomargarita akajimensis]ADE55585.1 NADH dehydrogenase (ubiquinone) 30 kDa subunit [Coraliomargarita akajimensis DSM 45221]